MKKLLLAIAITIVAVFTCPASWAARSFNGSSDCLQAASVDLSGSNKLTVTLWLYWDSFANNDNVALEFSPNWNVNTGSFYITPNSATGSQFAAAFRGNSTSLASIAYFTRPSAAAWHHYAWVVDMGLSTNEITAAYVDGVSQSLTYIVNNDNSGNFGNHTLNFTSRNCASLWGAGRLAEVALYSGVLLTADDVNALFRGASPRMVRPTVKPYYWPLLGRTSPELELFYGTTATVTGATQTDHPRIFLPR